MPVTAVLPAQKIKTKRKMDNLRKIVLVAASAGGIKSFLELLNSLGPKFPFPIFFHIHLSRTQESQLDLVIRNQVEKSIPVLLVEDGMKIRANHIYICRPGYNIFFENDLISLEEADHSAKFHPSIDKTIVSAAENFRDRLYTVILSGMLDDGIEGILKSYENGGITIVQDPKETKFPSMPLNAIVKDHPSRVLPVKDIARILLTS